MKSILILKKCLIIIIKMRLTPSRRAEETILLMRMVRLRLARRATMINQWNITVDFTSCS